ncbi:TauD/TfdA family dioxygenase [Aestuariicella hydrocarbonica]|uniref:TauD/TfdA family dioxygenase n=1 Tax=Pseudomaricurvus hydrocarbonicus TaxID=1470433 RepID=A0A9E5MHI7_9GAMM|nr:TauD/TfdA family dioxygenase [Aestuariicella hydrocarbonica]NHO65991.1 TauD/TfdA family dioxygenase [Aestuariicella hydrocarbonica]
MSHAAAVQATGKLKYENISEFIGSRILNSKEELLSGELGSELRELLEQRGVLVLPKIDFSDDEQVQFTETIGKFLPEIQGQKVYNISLDKEKNPNRDYLKGSLYWHLDGTMNKVPIGAAILTSKVLPTWGGNTEFCNTYAAYEQLSEEDKRLVADKKAMHSAWTSLFYYEPEPSSEQLNALMGLGEVNLPLVWTHQSGRKSLVLGCTAHHVLDMTPTESTRLLVRLREWATQPKFVYSHEWSVGDTVIWDNTGTMHRAMPYDPDCGRLLHRTKTEGVEPIQ